MFPESMPVFTKEDILIDENEYECGEKRTSVGWLKHLFLFSQPAPDDPSHLWITAEDRKDYNGVVDKFKKLCTIKGNLHDWEDSTSAKKQAACLNKLRKALGYTVIEEI